MYIAAILKHNDKNEQSISFVTTSFTISALAINVKFCTKNKARLTANTDKQIENLYKNVDIPNNSNNGYTTVSKIFINKS